MILKNINKLLMVLLTVFLVSGCTFSKNEKETIEEELEDKIMEITEWPENSFTKEVIEPQYGKADYVIDDSENGRYSVFYSEISMPQAEEYVDQMESLGYKKEAEYDEDLASGIVLIRDKTTLNISLTEGGLAISIAIEQ